jgi:flagellar biosynthesis regulator FlaF
MRFTKKIDKRVLTDAFEEHNWLRYVTYGAVAVLGIWALGKAAKLVTDAIVNFKNLNNVVKQ